MTLAKFNTLSSTEIQKALFDCCGSMNWAKQLAIQFPFSSEKKLLESAVNIWYNDCDKTDWQEAFTHHPKIGDLESLTEKFAGQEQASVASATTDVIKNLADANKAYDTKNGFIFIVCATGKSASEMLRLLEDRLRNTREEELHIAMGEQAKITAIRLKKLLPEADWSHLHGSQLTTHVLDTSLGRPGKNLTIELQEFKNNRWQTIAQGCTNADGRIADLLPPGKLLTQQTYKMVFDTDTYFKQEKVKGFYPIVEIQFFVIDENHYHIPLLLNPFGYSTYRGS